MTVTQYIGSRYVPIFEGEWDNTRAYEALTVVQHQGNSFTSRQPVPIGVDINNTEFWASTGNYNAQVEAYRQEVATYSSAIENLQDTTETQGENITTLQGNVSTLNDGLSTETTARQEADTTINNALNALDNRVDALELEGAYIGVIGDSFSTHNTYDYWPQILARKTGCTVINKAVNGTGFTQGNASTNFAGQLASLAADPHFNQLKCIIVYGGVNDFNLGSSAGATASAINSFITAYEALENRPPLILAFGNAGKANTGAYNNLLSWYQLVRDSIVQQDAVIVDAVPFWLLPFNSFNEDTLHPDAYGQHIIYKYMYKLITGTYAGQLHFHQAIKNGIKYTLHINNGVVNLHLRFVQNKTITGLQSNTFVEVANIIDTPLMFGDNNAGQNMGAWCYSWPLVYAIDGATNEIGIIRPLFNASNGNLYMQMFGAASTITDQTFTIGADQEMQFTIFPTKGNLL